MREWIKGALFLPGLLLLRAAIAPPEFFAQETVAPATVPEALRRPERGEAPRYPKDLVIGELGQGSAPGDAYLFAMDLLSFVVTQSAGPVPGKYSGALDESLREEINSIEPSTFRLGGGRVEADGSVSFMARVMGLEQSITGELFLRPADSRPVLRAAPKSAEAIPAEAAWGEETSATEIPAEILPGETTLAEETPAGENEASGNPAGQTDPSPTSLAAATPAGAASGAIPETVTPTPTSPGESTSLGVGTPGQWILDDLVLEEPRILSEITDSYRYDFSPYERFY